MAAWASSTPIGLGEALGARRTAEFAALARLHADGWGVATAGAGGAAVTRDVSAAPFPIDDAAAVLAARPGRTGLVYLRFASAGAPPAVANSQPFATGRSAFGHNGAFPREPALALLGDPSRRGLAGGTDSEVYFALVRERIAAHRAIGPGLADAAARLRRIAPDACLNAILVTPGAVHAVQSSAGRPPALARFAERGFAGEALPPGHDDAGYNRMRVTAPAPGVRVVATSGFDQDGWAELPEDTVTRITADAVETRGIADLVD